MKSGGRGTATRRMLKQGQDRHKRPAETVSTAKEAAAAAFFDLIRAYERRPSVDEAAQAMMDKYEPVFKRLAEYDSVSGKEGRMDAEGTESDSLV